MLRQPGAGILLRKEIDLHPAVGAGLLPVGGNLQDRRPGQSAVGEQHRLAEVRGRRSPGAGGDGVERGAGKVAETLDPFGSAGQRHQGRLRRYDGETELLGDAVAEGAGADLGNR